MAKIATIQNSKLLKMSVFGASKWPKLILRKIWVAENSWNFHIVSSQLGCPGLSVVGNTDCDNNLNLESNKILQEFLFMLQS